MLITPVDLVGVVDHTFAFGRQRRDQQRLTCADIRRSHFDAAERITPVETDDRCAVRVAENDLSAHVDQFIGKKQAAFKHFLVHQHAAPRLGGDYENDRHQVGRETRPGRIVNRQDRTVDKRGDFK